MSLRDQILADLEGIIENASDFGQEITLTDPDGVATDLVGLTGDISTIIDPDTGMLVKGRRLHVTLKIQSLPAGPRPEAQSDTSKKPWLVSFKRVTSLASTQYLVIGSVPDDSMGAIICELGEWVP
jgi:hypothetical protein